MIATAGLVDFHCHLDLYPDHAAAVEDANAAGVFTLAVTTTPLAWPRNNELAQKTKHVRAALGLHPQLIAEREHELVVWEKYISQTRYVGEVGLDAGPKYYGSFEAQKRVFQRILRVCAEQGGKIITVHSVRSTKAVLDHIENYLPQGKGKVVLHWFTGTQSEIRRAVDLGCYFSINAAMFSNEKRERVLETIPLERVLTETDGPFTSISGRPSKPSDVSNVVVALARMNRLSEEGMARKIRVNLRELLGASSDQI